ncbi:MAG TPA: DUF896 domain-containing protein [Oscillospiraceae bacterium]|nr:DUF896 domain-containing protein [Oscillospiraceae bacterium]HPF55518.1 DUF896 domain-containing protein [Clostridiales bacterium]HPK35708.1 DUF896 domain-containing protein [Oscillospiraceae bacterium]HPR76571.1 DUF896 domain-containing protein [Oscillospiraceae bacterium]
MVTQKEIDRINELAKKQREGGLTEDEKKEQTHLRALYVAAFRDSLRGQLDAITLVDKDGNKRKLKHK